MNNRKCSNCTDVYIREVNFGHNDKMDMEHCKHNHEFTNINNYIQEFREKRWDYEKQRYKDCPYNNCTNKDEE